MALHLSNRELLELGKLAFEGDSPDARLALLTWFTQHQGDLLATADREPTLATECVVRGLASAGIPDAQVLVERWDAGRRRRARTLGELPSPSGEESTQPAS
jgi:hypothetical protein